MLSCVSANVLQSELCKLGFAENGFARHPASGRGPIGLAIGPEFCQPGPQDASQEDRRDQIRGQPVTLKHYFLALNRDTRSFSPTDIWLS